MPDDGDIQAKLRFPPKLHTALQRASFENDLPFNKEVIQRLGRSVDPGYGPDRAPLLYLIDEVLRLGDPRGQWRDDPSKNEVILRGIARVLHRLQTPDDLHVFQDDSIEARVDEMLFDAGNDGSDHQGPPRHVHQWAADLRSRIGPLGPLLIKMRRAVREQAEALPPAEIKPSADAEIDAMWQRAFSKADAEAAEHRARQTAERREAARRRREQRK